MDNPDWGKQVVIGQALLNDAGKVLRARQRLDGLALDVLAAPGLGLAETRRLRTFLDGEWAAAAGAAARLATRTVAPDRRRGLRADVGPAPAISPAHASELAQRAKVSAQSPAVAVSSADHHVQGAPQ